MGLIRMRDWKRKLLALGSVICLFFIFLAHTKINVHTMTIDQPSPSIGVITENMVQLAEQEGFEGIEWSILWRGKLSTEQAERLHVWLAAPDQSFTQTSSTTSSSLDHPISEEIWTKQGQGTTYQLQLFSYPHKDQQITNFILVWSGDQENKWELNIMEIESMLATYFTDDYQVFTTIEGVTDPFFFDKDKHQNTFTHWIQDTYEGNISHSISDTNFLSVTGYIPTWGKQFLSAEHDMTNVQMSARLNAITEQTRVTLGYPLILKEH